MTPVGGRGGVRLQLGFNTRSIPQPYGMHAGYVNSSITSPKIENSPPFLVVKICVVRGCRNRIALQHKDLGDFLSLILTVCIAYSYGIPSLILTVFRAFATKVFHRVGTEVFPCLLHLSDTEKATYGESKVGDLFHPPMGSATCSK